VAENTTYLKNQEKIIELTEQEDKIKKEIAKTAKEIADAGEKATKQQKEQLRTQKIELEQKKAEKKITAEIGSIHESMEDTMDKEALLSFDILKNEKKLKDVAEQIKSNKANLGKAERKRLDNNLKAAKAEFESAKDAATEMQAKQMVSEKLQDSLGVSANSMRELKAQAILFGRAVMKNPMILLGAALVGAGMLLKKAITSTREFQKELGLSAHQAVELNKELKLNPKLVATAKLAGIELNDVAAKIQENFGDLNKVNAKNIEQLVEQNLLLGIQIDSSVKLAKTFMDVTGSSFETAMNFQASTAALAESNDVAPGDVIADIAENSESFAEFAKDGGNNIARAAIQAKKLGINLATTAKIADTLLDFESSIEKEMEASLLIGKQLNFNNARRLALEGDLAGAARDVVSQIGGQAELNRMNVIQRRALADSIGVSVEELSKLASGKLEVKNKDKSIDERNLEARKTIASTQEKLIQATDALKKATIALAAIMGVNALMKLPKTLKNLTPKLETMKSSAQRFTKKVTPKMTKAGNLSKREGLGRTLKDSTRNLKATSKNLTKSIVSKAPKALVKGGVVGAAVGGADIVSGIQNQDKGAIGGGAGAIIGGAIGSFIAPGFGTVVGSVAGQMIGEAIGSKLEASESIEDKQAEINEVKRKLEEEKAKLSAKDRKELLIAEAKGADALQKFIDDNDSYFGTFGNSLDNVAELLKTLNKKQDDLKNAVRELPDN